VDDVDVEVGVVEGGVEGDDELLVPVGTGVAFLVDPGGGFAPRAG